MIRRTRALVVSLALALTASAGVPGAADAVVPGTSTPREDTVYPSVGDPGADVLRYDLSLSWRPSSKTLTGTAKLTLRALRAGSFQLDLAHSLAVSRVVVRDHTTQAVVASTFTHPSRYLRVSAPSLAAGSTYDVTIRYRGTPTPVRAPSSRGDTTTLGWHTRRDGQVWAMQEPYGAFTWYPVNDHPSDKAMYDVRLAVPRAWVGVSNGRLTGRRVVNGQTVTTFTNRDPMASYLMTVAVGPYRRFTQTGPHGLPLSYWVPRNHPEFLTPLRATPQALRWLEARLGRYPFDRAGVVVTPSDSAMETQTMVTLGSANYQFGGQEIREIVLHELAHSWYGDTVTPNDWRDLWMNEGMAMYLEAQFTVDRGWASWAEWKSEFNRLDQQLRRAYGPPGDYHHDDFAQTNVYFCPARMWVRLRTLVGAATFRSVVRGWPQAHRNTTQDRAAYIDWIEARTGRELSAFFRTWLMSPTSPR